jgi:hypothetical protein
MKSVSNTHDRLGFRRDGYEERCLLGCGAVLVYYKATFRSMEATCSSETSVNNKPTRRHIPEDGILENPIRFPILSHACYMPCQFNVLRIDHSNVICRGV